MVKKRRRLLWLAVGIVATLALLFGGFYLYTQVYYAAAPEATAVYAQARDSDISIYTDGDWTILTPRTPSGEGFIFYPGGKVEETAYLPLLQKLAQRGVTCVLVRMPFRLAVLGIDRADGVGEKLPEVRQWYIGGHSLGGAMASRYAEKHAERIAGVVLLGAYPVAAARVPTLVLYGSEDRVLNREKLVGVENVTVIPGGNHAGFGNYGEQAGDGQASITQDAQQAQSVEGILAFMQASP